MHCGQLVEFIVTLQESGAAAPSGLKTRLSAAPQQVHCLPLGRWLHSAMNRRSWVQRCGAGVGRRGRGEAPRCARPHAANTCLESPRSAVPPLVIGTHNITGHAAGAARTAARASLTGRAVLRKRSTCWAHCTGCWYGTACPASGMVMSQEPGVAQWALFSVTMGMILSLAPLRWAGRTRLELRPRGRDNEGCGPTETAWGSRRALGEQQHAEFTSAKPASPGSPHPHQRVLGPRQAGQSAHALEELADCRRLLGLHLGSDHRRQGACGVFLCARQAGMDVKHMGGRCGAGTEEP